MSPDDAVVIAGGGGFIGGYLAQRLARAGYHDVRVVDVQPTSEWHQSVDHFENLCVDLRDLDLCRKVARDRAVVFDLAADMGGMGFIETHRFECMLSASIGINLVQACLEACVERLFFASSACVYNVTLQDVPAVAGLRECDAYPAMPEDGYGWEKLFTERLFLNAASEQGLKVRIGRFHNVYGPHGTWRGGREKAPAAICRKVAEAVISGNHEIEIWGDGIQTRSFTYIDDAVEGTLRLVSSDCDEPLNIGSERLISINELVDIVEGIAGVKLRRTYLADAPLGVRGRNSDNRLIRQRLEWEPSVELEDGLAATYAWVYDRVANTRSDLP